MYKLSHKSEKKLQGVNSRLAMVVRRAIEISKVDFLVGEGRRTVERQRKLKAQGKSQTMKSKHISGHAVDLFACPSGKISWTQSHYEKIADAMQQAAKELGVQIRWGAAWNVSDIREWKGDMKSAKWHYSNTRRKQGRKPFIDAVHFELHGREM